MSTTTIENKTEPVERKPLPPTKSKEDRKLEALEQRLNEIEREHEAERKRMIEQQMQWMAAQSAKSSATQYVSWEVVANTHEANKKGLELPDSFGIREIRFIPDSGVGKLVGDEIAFYGEPSGRGILHVYMEYTPKLSDYKDGYALRSRSERFKEMMGEYGGRTLLDAVEDILKDYNKTKYFHCGFQLVFKK